MLHYYSQRRVPMYVGLQIIQMPLFHIFKLVRDMTVLGERQFCLGQDLNLSLPLPTLPDSIPTSFCPFDFFLCNILTNIDLLVL